MKKFLFVIGIVLLLSQGCVLPQSKITVENEANKPNAPYLSIYALIFEPTRYDQNKVTIRAVLRISETGCALYPSVKDAENDSTISALWIGTQAEIGCCSKEQLMAMNGKYVAVTGIVEGKKLGPNQIYNCEMKAIESITELRKLQTLPPTDVVLKPF